MASKEMRAFLDGLRDAPRTRACLLFAGKRRGPADARLHGVAFHVFQTFTHFPESQDALAEIGAFYKQHI